MNLKPAIKYELSQIKKTVFIFYLIMYSIVLLSVVAPKLLKDSNIIGSMSGIEFSSIIFIFLVSLTTFESTMKIFIQNGLNRLTVFVTFICSIIPTVLFMSLIDSLNSLVINKVYPYSSLFDQIYNNNFGYKITNQFTILQSFLWSACIYLMFATLGFFIAILYYRMNKWQSLVFFIGIPSFIFIVFPILTANFQDLFCKLMLFMIDCLGIGTNLNPYNAILTFTMISVVFSCISYILIRKTPIKD